MNRTKQIIIKVGFMLCIAFMGAPTGCETYQQPQHPRGEYVVASPSVQTFYVEIRSEEDFYEPLGAYGRWVVVEPYRRCWIPERVDSDWRPYCNGHWVRTDAGWYWESDEPWAWATYHYGRWDWSPRYGWIWVPQTEWAPAWVSWRQGRGYLGWAPLPPSARFAKSGYIEFRETDIAPRAFVFVEERRFLEPVHSTTVIVNNTTIINKTVNITNMKVVNKTVINEGPRTEVIEQVSGHKVQAVQVQELRRKQESAVVTKQQTPSAAREKKIQTPVPGGAESSVKKAAPVQEPRQSQKPAVTTVHETKVPASSKNVQAIQEQNRAKKSAQPDERKQAPEKRTHKTQIQKGSPISSPAQAKPETKKSSAMKGPTEQEAEKRANKQEKSVKESEKKSQPSEQSDTKEQVTNGQGGQDTVKKDHGKKGIK